MKITVTVNRALEAVAFVSGFSLMAYELVAARLLAPAIGSSTYVWTSVIGVIMIALAIGYGVGGWLADKRTRSSDIVWLLLASSTAVAATLLTADGLLEVLAGSGMDARLKGLIASFILFMPASFLLGAISPYLVRLHTGSITVAGRSVASLSALNALGGISGTFATGFLFFSLIGSRETIGLIAILLALTSWLIVPRQWWQRRLLACGAIAIIGMQSIAPLADASTIASIDTASAHYTVTEQTSLGTTLRGLKTGPHGMQSGIYLDQPDRLAFDYTRTMADIVAAAPTKDSILVLGGGAFTLPGHLAATYPDSSIDVIEIDPELEDIAATYFGYAKPAHVTAIAEDGRAYLEHTTKRYDLILVDIYSDVSVPFATASLEYTRLLKQRLTPGGSAIVNMIGAVTPECRPLLGALHRSYAEVFNDYRAFPLEDARLSTPQNIIAVYSDHDTAWAANYNRMHASLPVGRLLRDNFAPVEALSYRCWES